MSSHTETGTTDWDHEDRLLAECDYYQGVGHCSFGCYEQPDCWEIGPDVQPNWHPMKVANVRGRRIGHRTQQWLGWQRMADFLAPPHSGSFSEVDQ